MVQGFDKNIEKKNLQLCRNLLSMMGSYMSFYETFKGIPWMI